MTLSCQLLLYLIYQSKKCLASLNIQCILGFILFYFILFYFILFYFILHPLRLLGACVFLQQTLFFLSWLVHDHLLGFTPASQIHLCPCLLCDYLGSVPTPPKIAQKNSDGKIHPLSLVNLMLPDLLRNIFCLLEINFKFLNNIFHCHGAVYMFYIK